MRIILSRKGVDTTYGEIPSPIFPDNSLRNLPIPECCSSTIEYSHIHWDSKYPTGAIVESLTQCKRCGKPRISASTLTHLDPDIDKKSLPRVNGWRGIFGQSDTAQSHLENQGVGESDLFLFFGLFRKTENNAKGLEFTKEARKHIIWGWLQVGETIDLKKNLAQAPSWSRYHPHVSHPERDKNNTIYFGKEKLEISGITKPQDGYGVFPSFDSRLQLTVENEKNHSVWCLPRWFEQRLSYHEKAHCWHPCEEDENKIILNSVGRGQEFVIDIDKLNKDEQKNATEWLQSIFACAK
jgi:hypothetical protein